MKHYTLLVLVSNLLKAISTKHMPTIPIDLNYIVLLFKIFIFYFFSSINFQAEDIKYLTNNI